MWQADCENFYRALLPFQLRDVGPEHQSFMDAFTKAHDLECIREGSTVTFYPVPK